MPSDLATKQQCLVTSPRDPGVVSLHVNAGHFSTTARRVTSPTWGPPPPCKQALTLHTKAYTTWITYNVVRTYLHYNTITYDTNNTNAFMITHVAYND